MKQKTKVNPYAKKKVVKKGLTRKQWTVGGILLAVIAIIVLLVIFGPKNNPNSGVDPHAGHNHAPGEGHDDETTTTTGGNANHGHNSNASSETGVLNYRVYTSEDKTYTLSVMDDHNKVVFSQAKLPNAPIKEDVNDDIFSLGWATGKGPNDFAQIFCNKKTGAVSREFYAPKGFDGVRVAYPSKDQTKIIVEDIFNANGYHKEYTLKDGVSKDGNIVIAGKTNKDQVAITYFTDDKGTTSQTVIRLYA